MPTKRTDKHIILYIHKTFFKKAHRFGCGKGGKNSQKRFDKTTVSQNDKMKSRKWRTDWHIQIYELEWNNRTELKRIRKRRSLQIRPKTPPIEQSKVQKENRVFYEISGSVDKSWGPKKNPGVQKFSRVHEILGSKKKSWGPKFWGPESVHKLRHYD